MSDSGPYKSLGTLIGDQDINQDLAIQAALDFKRIVSGYDVLSSTNPNRLYQNEKYLLHAPQPFLWSADKDGLFPSNSDERYFAYPIDPTFPQRLNDFNLRNKYFNSGGACKSN
jgi:curved DNA-binding protein CbpA